MKWPGKDNIDLAPEGRSFELPPEGSYVVKMTGTKTRDVSSGTWMAFQMKIDSGEHKGFQYEEEFWISKDGQKMAYTYARLGNICEATQFWPDISPDEEIAPEAFALLWEPGLRWTTDLVHDYQNVAWVNVDSYKDYTKTAIAETEECPFKKYLRTSKAGHDEWVKAGGKTWDSMVPAAQKDFLSGVELQAAYGPAPDNEVVDEEDMVEMVADGDLPF